MSYTHATDGPINPRYRPAAAWSGTAESQRSTGILIDPRDDVVLSTGRLARHQTVAEFLKHKKKWIRETRHLSSPVDRYMHPSYVRIIGLGPDALGPILADLKAEQNDWFYALQYIAGANPITAAMAGDFDQMVNAWLEWGEDNDLI